MVIAHILFSVKPDQADTFIRLTLDNVAHSRQESGVVGFDFYRTSDSGSTFLLFEQYKTAQDQSDHRATSHYQRWKAGTAELLAAPYSVSLFENLA